MKVIDHDAAEFNPDSMPQDAGVFFLSQQEAAGPPRKVTPFMRAVVYYLFEELRYPEDTGNKAYSRITDIINVFPIVGFFILCFSIPFALVEDTVNLHWLGWLLSGMGFLMITGGIYRLNRKKKLIKEGYAYILNNGSIQYATVMKHLTNDRVSRQLTSHRTIVENGVPMDERQWIFESCITIAIENTEIEFITFRPEIISVYNTGLKVPVLWHPRWPKLFIPVES